MERTHEAKLFYGYIKRLTGDNENVPENLEELDNTSHLDVELTDNDEGESTLLIGREIKTAEEKDAVQITASELLDQITSIKSTEQVKKIEAEMNLEDEKPQLVLTCKTE